MRQVLIEKNKAVKQVSQSKLEFLADNTLFPGLLFKAQRVVTMKMPFRVDAAAGGSLDLDFTASPGLAESGISLLGAYWEKGVVRASFVNLSKEDIAVEDGYPLLIGTLIEVVALKQVSNSMSGGVVIINKPTEKKRRRKPKAT